MKNESKLQMRVKGNKIIKQVVLQSRDFTEGEKLMFYTHLMRSVRELKVRQIERMTHHGESPFQDLFIP